MGPNKIFFYNWNNTSTGTPPDENYTESIMWKIEKLLGSPTQTNGFYHLIFFYLLVVPPQKRNPFPHTAQ